MIALRERYALFTHLPGKESVVPLSHVAVRAYPTKIFVGEVEIDLLGISPIEGFTHLVDIDRARVEIFGRGGERYVHLFLFAERGEIFVKLYRGDQVELLIDGEKVALGKKEKQALFSTRTMERPPMLEKISFGCAKKPLLENGVDLATKTFAMAQLIPKVEGEKVALDRIAPFIHDLFSPKTKDELFLGIGEIEAPAFSLFSSLHEQMKHLLVQEKEGELLLLEGGKKLPAAGRAKGLLCSFGAIDLLWRKGRIIRLHLFPTKDALVQLHFPGRAKNFRLKQKLNARGEKVASGTSLSLEPGKAFFLDKITY